MVGVVGKGGKGSRMVDEEGDLSWAQIGWTVWEPGSLRLRVGVRLDGRMSWSAWLHLPPVVPVLEQPGSLLWRIFLPWDIDVKGWASGDPVRVDGGAGEGLWGRVVRT